MSTRRGPRVALLVVLALLGGFLAGCSDDSSNDTATGTVSAADEQTLLDARAAAIHADDLPAFLATLDQTDKALVARQRRYYVNLRQLPLETFSYKVLGSDWPTVLRDKRWATDVNVPQVRVSMQLEGFDKVPVRRVTGFAFARDADGKPIIISELTGTGQQYPGSQPAPWDLVAVHVQSDAGTLQLYDASTWAKRSEIGSVVDRGIANIEKGVPFPWDGRAVVYVFSKKVVLNSFEGVPGGNIRHLGAMTFPMYADPGQPVIAGTRFTLLPSSIQAGQPFLDRIVRHELTHVAVGDRDDGAPVWFAEGLAEYMGARSIRKVNRRIATVAVTRARDDVHDMPASTTFNGRDQAWNYALSWMACDYIAATQGSEKLWQLMDALHASGAGTTDAEQDAVLLSVLGFDSHELARRAAKRILRIYG
jgi:hypothetical protein